ncbi:MAG: hypothetical protein N2D54_02320, partial [Chloroflexota bacterium]
LGLSRNPAVHFSQSPLVPGMQLLLTPVVPPKWNEETFKETVGQQLNVLRRRFLAHAGDDLRAVFLETRVGKGTIDLIQSSDVLENTPPAKLAAPMKSTPIEQPKPRAVEPVIDEPDAVERPAVKLEDKTPSAAANSSPMNPNDDEQDQGAQKKAPQTRIKREVNWGPALLKTSRKIGDAFTRITENLNKFIRRILPSDELGNLPNSAMVFTAIAVPLVVVAVSSFVYLRIGRTMQFDTYLAEAQAQAQTGNSGGTRVARRAAWGAALENLELAESYDITEDSQALRTQAQAALDELDEIVRMEFQPAIAGSLPASAKIRRMIATGRDIYMLDISKGLVMRAWLTGSGYEIDPDFRCGPGKFGPIIVGVIIDIAELPRSDQNTPPIVALDANGNLLYCQPEEPPVAVQLITPDSNWGDPTSITVENGNLYILDPLTNAVWIYFGEDNEFREPPQLYFVDVVPSMQGAIDFSVSRDDLYVLYSDGHIVTCNCSTLPEAPTNCTDPAIYADSRPGKEDGEVLQDARFFQMFHTQPPEPSLYFLDPLGRSIFHFSLRINLVQQYRPQPDMQVGLATAFAISPTRSVFLALENEVFIGFLP